MNIEITKQTAQPTIYIRIRMSLDSMTEDFNTGYGKLMAYLSELGESIAAPPYAAYYNSDMNDMDTEMGIPVSKPLPEKGEIKSGSILPFEKTVSAIHKGSYDTLHKTYEKVYQYIADNKLTIAGPHYDFYISDPANTSEEEMITKVAIPIK